MGDRPRFRTTKTMPCPGLCPRLTGASWTPKTPRLGDASQHPSKTWSVPDSWPARQERAGSTGVASVCQASGANRAWQKRLVVAVEELAASLPGAHRMRFAETTAAVTPRAVVEDFF